MSPPVAIITGASQGIGAGLVTGYRSAGYAVVGVALSFPPADRDESDYVAVAGDIADAQTARRAVDQARDRFGRIDTLINNAGIYIGKPFTEYTFDEYEAITAVNLTGFFHITQLAIAEMVARGSGHVVNVSTSLVDNADSTRPSALPALTKGGLVAASRFACDRIRLARRPRQRGLARGHQDTRPRPRVLRRARGPPPARARRRSQRRRRRDPLPRASDVRNRRDAAR